MEKPETDIMLAINHVKKDLPNVQNCGHMYVYQDIKKATKCARYVHQCKANTSNKENRDWYTNRKQGSGMQCMLGKDIWNKIAELLLLQEMQVVENHGI